MLNRCHFTRRILSKPNTAFRQSQRRSLLTIGIESSADDTCVAILETNERLTRKAQLHFNQRITAKNTGHGGIHPIEALDSHRSNLSKLVDRSLSLLPQIRDGSKQHEIISLHDGSTRQKPDFVSVTRGPGMRSNLSCGLDTAKGLATAWQIPLVGVHHMQAHALTPRLVDALQADDDPNAATVPKPNFPFLTLLVSGGHTILVHSRSLTQHAILATTRDIAIGDALDKAGRTILLEEEKDRAPDTAYGKYLSAFAFQSPDEFTAWPVPKKRGDEIDKPHNKFGWRIQSPLAETKELAFSFAGIGSEVDRLMRMRTQDVGQITTEERVILAQTAVGIAFEHLGSKTIIALRQLQSRGVEITTLVVSGGVAANNFLRYFLRQLLDIRGFDHVELVFPPVPLCTDNAAMIAWAGMEMFRAGYTTDRDCDARRKWSMDGDAEDGGILGVRGENYLVRENS